MKINKKHLHSLIKKELLREEIEKMKSRVKQKQIKEEIDNAQATQQLNLLSKIADRMDKLSLDTIVKGLADVDVSIDALTAALTGASAMALGIRQGMHGRMAPRAKKHHHDYDDEQRELQKELEEGFGLTNGGGGLGIGTPSTANAAELAGGTSAPVLGWEEIDEIKDPVRKAIMNVLKDYVNNLSDAYEMLSVIVSEIENELGDRGPVQNGDEMQRYLPLQERRKRSERVPPKGRTQLRVTTRKSKTKGKTRK